MNKYIYEKIVLTDSICDKIIKNTELESCIEDNVSILLPLYPEESNKYYNIVNEITDIIIKNIVLYLNNINYKTHYENLVQTNMSIFILKKNTSNNKFKNELVVFDRFNSYILCIIFLNESTDSYIEFWNGYKVISEKGKIVLFPATWDFIYKHNPSILTDNYYIKTILYEY